MSKQMQTPSGSGTIGIVAWGMTSSRLGAHLATLGPSDALLLADPSPADDLRDAVPRGTPAPQILRTVFGAQAGEAELIVHSLPGLYSLSPETQALRDIFPGLHARQRRTVRQESFSVLAERLARMPAPLRLVIETPGMEMPLLAALETAGVLGAVTVLHLRAGREVFFAGAESARTLCTWLLARQFSLASENDGSLDWPEFRFVADLPALRHALHEARAATQAQDSRIAELEAALHAETRSSQEHLARQTSTIETLEAQVAGHLETLSDRNSEMQHKDAAIADLEAELAGQAQQKKALSARNRDLEERLLRAREDLRRAEGQMDVIKDLLLRESGL